MVTIFLNMMNNDEFRRQFITAFSIVGGSVFSYDPVDQIPFDMGFALSDGGWVNPWNTVYNVYTGFYDREPTMMQQLRYFPEARLTGKTMRTVNLSTNISEATLTLDGRKVPYSSFTGHLLQQTTACAVAPVGYEFLGWVDTNASANASTGTMSQRKALLDMASSLGIENAKVVTYDSEYEIPDSRNSFLYAIFRPIDRTKYEDGHRNPIIINEVGGANSMYENDMFKKTDWMELYNMSDKAIDIAGMYLSDDPNNTTKYQIPENDKTETVVPAHGFLTVWATNEPAAQGSGALHADIVLHGNNGGAVSLYDADNKLEDLLPYGPHGGRQSVGRYPDGSRDVYTMDRTSLGNANFLNSYSEYLCNSDDYKAPSTGVINSVLISMKKGWNWVSHPLDYSLNIAAINQYANSIQGQTKSAICDQSLGWVGTLTELEPALGYKIDMQQAADYTLRGNMYPAGNTVMLHKGWNWIGYPVVGTKPLADALSLAHCEEGDAIIGQEGIATYEHGKWTGSLAVLTTGSAYMYKSKSLKSIVFNSTKTAANARMRTAIEPQPHTPWSAQTSAHPNVMGVVATVINDGIEAASGAYSVGVFDEDGECRGIGRYADSKLWLTISGEGGEALHLQASDASTGVIYDINETLTFQPDMYGTCASPVALTIGEATDIASVRRSTALESVEYYSMDGIRVATDKSSLRPGIYVARYHISGGQVLSQKIKIVK